MIAAAGPASTVRSPATCRPRNPNWFVTPSTHAIASPRRPRWRTWPANGSSATAPMLARPAATQTGPDTSSATRCTTNISPHVTHRTTASTRVSARRSRQPSRLTPPALPATARRLPAQVGDRPAKAPPDARREASGDLAAWAQERYARVVTHGVDAGAADPESPMTVTAEPTARPAGSSARYEPS